LNTLWLLIVSDPPVCSEELSQLSIQLLSELLGMGQFEKLRIPHIELAMKSLTTPNAHVLKLLQILTNLLSTFPAQSAANEWNQNTLISALDEKLFITKVFFEQLIRFHDKQRKIFPILKLN